MPPTHFPIADWLPTHRTLHLFLQIMGKLQLAYVPKRNHWWHATLRLAPRGISTQTLCTPAGPVRIELDLVGHEVVTRCDAKTETLPLRDGLSVAQFYRNIERRLTEINVSMKLDPKPFDYPDGTTPFPEDEAHHHYDAAMARKAHDVLAWVGPIFETYRGRFLGKSSPVHMYWHHFDLAVARFSGKPAPERDAGQVEHEAYSHEVISSGFWFGDDTVPEPTFYSYTAPAPDNLTDQLIQPDAATWGDGGTAGVSLKDILAEPDPRAALLAFLQTTYDAGATTAGWDTQALHLDEPGVA
jgi:hypothetical protein